MIHFNELRIDGKHLIIEAEIDSDRYFDNVFIDSIIIDTQDTYVPNGPSKKPVFTYTTEKQKDLVYSIPECGCNPIQVKEDLSYCFIEGGIESKRKVRLVLSAKDLGVDLDNNIFFVYVKADGTPADDTPCGYDVDTIMNTVVNLKRFYNISLGFIKELNNSCETPKGFIDMILRFKALELSIKTGHYLEAIKIWKKCFTGEYPIIPKTKCNCNGRNN